MPIGVSSAPYAKFVNPGDRHGGEIVDFRVVQNSDPKLRVPLYLQQSADGKWAKVFTAYGPDGKPNDPIVQWEITVDTGVEDENGDSELRIFVDPRKGRRGSTTEGKKGGDAVAIALKKVKAHRTGLEIGGTFFLIFQGKINDGDNKVNTWSAEYTAPEGGVGTGKAVDEMPWLVGGGRYDKAAELNKWETGQVPALATSIARAQQSTPATASPRAAATAGLGIRDTTVTQDDEPPF